MSRDDEEMPLAGGRVTEGVVRVGDTVRRPSTASSTFVGALLTHLERYGFEGAPRYLGTDEKGRDILTYISGWVPPTFRRWSDAQVGAAGALLRGLHEATRTSDLTRTSNNLTRTSDNLTRTSDLTDTSDLTGTDLVVCHHDPGPNNVVFRDDLPVAFIDFDTAAPGDPLEDLGYMAWTWCVSSRPDRGPVTAQAAQVRLLADAYGLAPHRHPDLIDAMMDRQACNARWWHGYLGRPGPRGTGEDEILARIAWSRREHDHTAAHRAEFAAALR
ncbi:MULTISPECIES: aminoglycoside phosphotransferase family protein [unclassified Streptomyces]|uniref:aminoglycoside phosphotransferase family protein n=1 Tax=unclassified Streptomyces TaxID=2593676 RepID=UPI0022592279|nr:MULTISPECIES: aminoglycoside phosphotransferase family protein [unclassified Streptomyces]MCX5048270.1 aminoglycoside phosphotransferase family protein [Streptomyces sp. NBC_00474]